VRTIAHMQRKLKMAQYSTGGFIVLPGGYGTFEELMEMVTWNQVNTLQKVLPYMATSCRVADDQLGIHKLPVIVVNGELTPSMAIDDRAEANTSVGNFYTPMVALLEGGVSAGFIAPQNLSLLKVVDLEGGAEANADDSKADQWGAAVLKALKEWSLPVGTVVVPLDQIWLNLY
jgi:hypothetical protein